MSVREDAPAPARAGMRRLVLLLPLVACAALGAVFYARLDAGDPAIVPSALIGRPVPNFSLPPLPTRAGPGLDDAALRAGHVTIVNLFASWCAQCHEEHPLLLALSRDPKLGAMAVELDGIAYKDNSEDARRYLGAKGDPYRRVGNDASGRAAIDFGVYGVPETFVVKGDGTIAFKLIGPVTDDNVGTLLAAVADAAAVADPSVTLPAPKP